MQDLPESVVAQLHAARESLDDAAVLLSLVEVGALEVLAAAPQTAEDLAQATGCVASRLLAALDLAVLLGLLVRTQDRYALPGGPRRPLRLPPTPLAELLGIKGLTPALLRGAPPLEPPGSGGRGDPARRDRFLRYLDGVSQDVAAAVAQAVPGPVGHVVDLGSGAGTYAHALLARWPDATATLVDRAETGALALALAGERGLAGRIDFQALALDQDPLPVGDTLLLSNVVHCFSAAANGDLVARAAAALRPGGRLVIKDYGIADDRSGPPAAVRFALSMALSTDGGGVYPAAQVAAWCSAAGLAPRVVQEPAGIPGSYLVIATR